MNHLSFNHLAVSSPHLLRHFAVLSIRLLISVSHSQLHYALWSAFGLPQEFNLSLCLLYLYLSVSPRHNSRRRSLFMRVLSHSVTHYLNRHMVGCGCHEILIQPCIMVLFLSNFSLCSVQLWFWWLSFANHSFQLISIQYTVHHSDPPRNHQSCNQELFILASNWRQAYI